MSDNRERRGGWATSDDPDTEEESPEVPAAETGTTTLATIAGRRFRLTVDGLDTPLDIGPEGVAVDDAHVQAVLDAARANGVRVSKVGT